ncbi:MAG: ABC transporter ATP-binding protein [Candidatus Lambdaproteobacteria bacterium]|nr:ABC transporter ATP-binding protein [Candidatus Lambdaproteobacteria bacterium]
MTSSTPSQPAPRAFAGPAPAALRIEALSFDYGRRHALREVTLDVGRGELLGLLGPNGSGKSTLLRILSTLLPCPPGRVWIDGLDAARQGDAVRRRIGVAFQSPSLDGKLSVQENVRFQGWLYGLHGAALAARGDALLTRFGLAARRHERAETLSGGLQRRVELAKALLHAPPLLLLDEPSTGLDPAARLEFWNTLHALRAEGALTIVAATHLMDEAERCDRVALMDEGRLMVADTPAALKSALGGEVLTLECSNPPGLAAALGARLGLAAQAVNGVVRLAEGTGREAVARILQTFAADVLALHVSKPTLEDVFIARTGHRFNRPEGA